MEEKVTIRLIRNATLRIRYAGKEILLDPMLAEKGTLQSALGVYKTPRVHLTMPMNEITNGVDMVLLTHNHIDHYDPTVKQHLPQDILFLTQPQDKGNIMQDGFTTVSYTHLTLPTNRQNDWSFNHSSYPRTPWIRTDWRNDGPGIWLCTYRAWFPYYLYNE